MRIFLYLLFCVCCFFSFKTTTFAQVQHSGWLGSFNTIKLNDKFSLHAEGQLRITDNADQVQTIILRPGLNYHINKSLAVTAGYAFIPNRRTIGKTADLLSEHRIWQQLLYNQKISTVSVAHRLRLEQRFIPKARLVGNELDTNGYDEAYRLRYFIRNIVPLVKQEKFNKGWFVALQNEVFLNIGDKSAVNGRVFDQNRIYGAIGYRVSNKFDVEAGYLNQYSKTRSSFTNNHAFQIAFYRKF